MKIGKDYAIGAGGSEHHGMKFQPRQLVNLLNYISANISKELKEKTN